MGIHECVFLICPQHGTDIFYRDGRNQRHASFAVFHRIVRTDAKHNHCIAGRITAHGRFLFPAAQRLLERHRVGKMNRLAAQHFDVPVRRTECKIIKVPDTASVNQFFMKRVHAVHIRRDNCHHCLCLFQLQINERPEMSDNMVVYACHIHISHFVDGLLANPAHIASQMDERFHTNQQKKNKAPYQELRGAASFLFICTFATIFFCTFHIHKIYPSQLVI